ncbi:hypothetical protein Ccrd_011337 [Cynara cardunculus var. scolymus]|uniref:Uncharacterized protein n=1 Tax=Cynara cardunculus var. scolymus TaxID=59895 RepID=A0A103YJH4_CYNCS|nr:hypothetical protein Ccrd_011337 [Cynara cardunculus var. scolymus]
MPWSSVSLMITRHGPGVKKSIPYVILYDHPHREQLQEVCCYYLNFSFAAARTVPHVPRCCQTVFSLTSNEMCYASRNLLQATPTVPQPQVPTIPTLPQPQIPTIPTLPQPQIPTIPTLPQPQIPIIPSFPNMPKVTLPPLPSMPTIPNFPTTLPKIPFFAPPPSKK